LPSLTAAFFPIQTPVGSKRGENGCAFGSPPQLTPQGLSLIVMKGIRR
jgi:hypothetical protein